MRLEKGHGLSKLYLTLPLGAVLLKIHLIGSNPLAQFGSSACSVTVIVFPTSPVSYGCSSSLFAAICPALALACSC